MIALLTVIHVIVCIFLILVVLLQQGKGQDIGSAFGGGGSQTAFGSRSSATLLTRLTTVAAALFMLTSITLTIMISRPAVNSVIEENAISTPADPADALPAAQAPATPDTDAPAPDDDAGGGLSPAPVDEEAQ